MRLATSIGIALAAAAPVLGAVGSGCGSSSPSMNSTVDHPDATDGERGGGGDGSIGEEGAPPSGDAGSEVDGGAASEGGPVAADGGAPDREGSDGGAPDGRGLDASGEEGAVADAAGEASVDATAGIDAGGQAEAGDDSGDDSGDASADGACVFDADIVDAPLGDAGATTGSCLTCIDTTCAAQASSCRADCTCDMQGTEILNCIGTGQTLMACVQAAHAGPLVTALVQCAQAVCGPPCGA